MKTTRKVFASLLTLLVASFVHAADSKPVARVISVTEVETTDTAAYVSWVNKMNEVAKAKLGIDTYYHVYSSWFDGVKSGTVYLVVAADSNATMIKNRAALGNEPEMTALRDRTRTISKLGARTLSQGVHFEGSHKGSYNYTTFVRVTDEAGYLKSLDGLRALLDKNGLPDIKINVYRVTAGRTNYTHRVTLAAPSNEKQAALLDYIGTDAAAAEWVASAAKFRTVVSNYTARDLAK